MDIFDGVTRMRGLGLFRLGMSGRGQALERRAGGGLRTVLGGLTTGKRAGLLTGLWVAAVIQSSPKAPSKAPPSSPWSAFQGPCGAFRPLSSPKPAPSHSCRRETDSVPQSASARQKYPSSQLLPDYMSVLLPHDTIVPSNPLPGFCKIHVNYTAFRQAFPSKKNACFR